MYKLTCGHAVFPLALVGSVMGIVGASLCLVQVQHSIGEMNGIMNETGWYLDTCDESILSWLGVAIPVQVPLGSCRAPGGIFAYLRKCPHSFSLWECLE